MLQRDRGLALSAWQVWESPFWACTLVVGPRVQRAPPAAREGRGGVRCGDAASRARVPRA
eukprot:982302-Prymnesium_polylepis.1